MQVAYLSAQFSDIQFKWNTVIRKGMQSTMISGNGDTTMKMQKFC